jgi:hypothetical protein
MTPQGPPPPHMQPTGQYVGAPPPGPYGYGYPPPMYAPPATTTSTTAIVSLVCGVVGWTVVPFIGALIAVITGHIARGEIRRSAGRVTGGGMATAGLVLGYIQIVGIVLLIAVIIVIAVASSTSP